MFIARVDRRESAIGYIELCKDLARRLLSKVVRYGGIAPQRAEVP